MNPMSFLDTGRYTQSHRPTNRQTIWPTTSSNGVDVELSAPWPARYGSFKKQNKRWTGAFDNEARASRMSFMFDNTLLPRAQNPREHQRWTRNVAQNRTTWLGQLQEPNTKDRVWSGEFNVERRPSWVSRASERYSADLDIEKYDAKDDPFTVSWEDGDEENPLNFKTGRKWFNAMLIAFACHLVSIGSSGFSQGPLSLGVCMHKHDLAHILQALAISSPSSTSAKPSHCSLPPSSSLALLSVH